MSTKSQPSASPRVPDHTLMHRIGAGSYGEVWLARSVVGTMRAVKIVRKASFKTERPYEREFSGMLKFEPVSRSHEGLMDILQIGRNDEEGYFYYVMELADDAKLAADAPLPESDLGVPPKAEFPRPALEEAQTQEKRYRPLTLAVERVIQGQLPLPVCLRFFSSLTSGLATMHQAGLIHRDIKPSNIIIVGGVAKLADIGLVADMDETRSFVGTEGFIPPEGPGTAQGDVYSLGKVLYEVAMGKDRKDYPSLPLMADAKNPPQDLLELNAIISRACASDLKERYANAMEMHADVAVLQAGRSVRGLHAFEGRLRAAKRGGLIAAAIAAVAVGAFALASWKAGIEHASRSRTEAALERVAAAEQLARRNLYESLVAGAVAERRSDLMGRRFRALDIIRRAVAIEPGTAELRDAAISALALPDVREIQRIPLPVWASGHGVSTDLRTRFIAGTNGIIHARTIGLDQDLYTLTSTVARSTFLSPLDPDGRWLAVQQDDSPIEYWNLEKRQRDTRLKGHVWGRVSPNKQRQIAVSADGRLLMIDIASGQSHSASTNIGSPTLVEFVDNDTVAVVSYPSVEVRLVDWNSGEARSSFTTQNGELPTAMQISPDGGTIGLGFDSGEVAFYPTQEAKVPRTSLTPHDAHISRLAFHPDGDWCLTASWDNTTRLVGASDGQLVSLMRSGNSYQHFSSDGTHLGAYESGGRALILSECAGREVCRVLGESVPPNRNQVGPWNGAFSPDGRLLASASYDGIRLYETRLGRELAHFSERLWYAVAFMGSSNLYSAGPNGLARWPLSWRGPDDLLISQREYSEAAHQWHLQASQQGTLVASADLKARLLLRFADGTRKVIQHGGEVRGLALSPDGHRVTATFGTPPTAVVWDTETGKELRRILTTRNGLASFDPSGTRLAVNEADAVVVWDLGTGQELWRTPLEHGGLAIVWSPDGQTVAALRESMVPVLLDASTGQRLARLEHPDPRPCNALAFSPDSSQLACFLTSHRIQLWNLRALRRELAALKLDWNQPPIKAGTIATTPRVKVEDQKRP